MEDENKRMRQPYLIILICAAVLGPFAGGYIYDSIKNKDVFDKKLMRAVSEINKNAPMMIDSETRLDRTIAYSEKKMEYQYTLINYSASDIPDMSLFKSNIGNMILIAIKNEPKFAEFRKKGVTFSYIYNDKNGDELMRFEYRYDDYNDTVAKPETI